MRMVPDNPGSLNMLGFHKKDRYIAPDFMPDYNYQNFTVSANVLYGVPFFTAENLTVNAVGIYVQTTVSSSHARIGVYENKGNMLGPGNLLRDWVEFDTSGSQGGTREKVLTEKFRFKGGKVYWIVFLSDSAITVYGGKAPPWYLGTHYLESGTPNYARYVYASQSYGALPSTFPSLGGLGSPSTQGTFAPIIYMRTDNVRFMEREGSLIITDNVGDHNCCAIDVGNQRAYFGQYVSATCKINKINLSNFTFDSALSLSTGEEYLGSAVLNSTHGYFGGATGRIVKILLSDFSRVGSILTNTYDSHMAAVMDDANGYAYFSGLNSTGSEIGLVVRILLSNFTATRLTLTTTDKYLYSACIDTVNQKAYFGCETTLGRVVKIDLATFTMDTSAQVGNYPITCISYYNSYVYAGSSYGQIFKLNPSDLSVADSFWAFDDEKNLQYIALDGTNGIGYFVSWLSQTGLAGKIVKVEFGSGFKRLGALYLAKDEEYPQVICLDTANNKLYVGHKGPAGSGSYSKRIEKIGII